MVEPLERRVLLSSELFFAATTPANGTELWSYIGTGSPVRRSDVRAGAASGSPQELTSYNGRIYFSADDGISGRELYTFNGTSTVRVADINTGVGSSSPEGLTVFNGLLYFSADDGVRGEELWVYNSTTNQATLAADVNTSPGPAGTANAGSTPLDITVFNNKLYFSATTGTSDREVWSYNPSTLSASRIADIRPGTTGSSPNALVVFENKLYFGANDGVNGDELWRYDGTNAPTMVADINPGAASSSINETIVFNDKIYMAATRADVGMELFSYDGTSAALVANLYPGADQFNNPTGSNPASFVLFNNRLFFTASQGNGAELWSYDGTNAPTVVDSNFTTPGFGTNVVDPAVFNNQLYFGVNSLVDDGELYRYSGSGSVQLVANLYPGTTPAPGYPGGVTQNGSYPSSLVVVDSTNFAPVISDTPDQAILPNGSKTVNFTVSDTETPAGSLAVVATSSNTALFPANSLVLGGTGGNRTLTLTPTAGMTGVSATITLTVLDFGGLTATDTFDVFVGPINAAPVLDITGNPTFDAIPEDPITNTGLDVPTLISRLGGTKITDADSGALQGIAVTGVTEDNGHWEFSLNSGTNWTSFNGAADGLARLLPSSASARVRFVPNANFFGTVTPGLTFRAWDQTSGSAGGTADTRTNGARTAFSVNSESASIMVTSVNDTPDAVDDTVTTDKTLTRAISVKSNDTDADNDVLTINQLNGAAIGSGATVTLPSGAKVTLNSNQTFTYNPNGVFNSLTANATASDSFTYRISDPAGASDTATVSITVTNVQLVVNTTADTIDSNPDVTSLREAVIAANATPTDATIVLGANDYVLSRLGALENAAQTGDLDITDTVGRLTIVGAGSGSTTISATSLADRVFHVMSGTSLELRGMLLRDGLASDDGTAVFEARGGGILNAGTLKLSDVGFNNNRAFGAAGANGVDGFRGDGPAGSGQIQAPTNGSPGKWAFGGAIYSTGTLTADAVSFSHNAVRGGDGGRGGTPLTVSDGVNTGLGPQDDRSRGADGREGGRAEGGAIFVKGTATLTNVVFDTNSVIGGNGGNGATGATLKGTTNAGGLGGDAGPAHGGALMLDGNVNITTATFTGNSATGGNGGNGGDRGLQPGGPYAGTPESGGNAGAGFDGQGGAVYFQTGATIAAATFSANTATGGNGGVGGSIPGSSNAGTALTTGAGGAGGHGQGGAVFADANSVVRDSLLQENHVARGNGGLGGGGSINGRVDGANGNGDGAGALAGGASLTIANSTITLNSTDATGRGGGLAAIDGDLITTNATIVANTAQTGGGIFNGPGGNVRIENTLIAKNTASFGFNVFGTINNADHSLLENATGSTGMTNGVAGNIVGVDPKIGALADNGGLRQTYALLVGSPALDAGSNALATGRQITTDQRGTSYPRFADAADADTTDTVDIGAYEANPMLPDLGDVAVDEDLLLTFSFDYGDADQVVSHTITSDNSNLVNTLQLTRAGSVANVTGTFKANQVGSTNVTVTLTASNGRTISDTFKVTVNPANDPPEFTAGPSITVNEDAGSQQYTGWATGIRPGPVTATDEVDQTVSFEATVTGTTGNLSFTTAPAVSFDGALKFAAAPDAYGTATVSLKLRDNGAQFPGAINNPLSAAQVFTITVNPLNDAPTLNVIANPSNILEDAPQQSIPLTGISAGPGEIQGLTFSASASDPTLFGNFSVDYTPGAGTATLHYTPLANANGSATIKVTVTDDGGTGAGEVNTFSRTFLAAVSPVNDAPTLDVIPNLTNVEKDGGVRTVQLTGITPGPANENQNLSVVAVSSNPAVVANPGVFYEGGDSFGSLSLRPMGTGQATITVTVTDNGAGFSPNVNTFVRTFTVGVQDTLGPVVTQVLVNGTNWTSAFRNVLAGASLGNGGFAMAAPADQLKPLPWTNLDQILVRFNENVSVQQNDLGIIGVNVPAYAVSAFTYDPATFTAAWTLSTPILNDKLMLNLDGTTANRVVDIAGNGLDGEWLTGITAFPSGNGIAGGNFLFRMNVLPGDVNRSGASVVGSDVTLVRNAQNFSPGTTGYSPFYDVNGNGQILGSDVTLVRNNQGLSLPTTEPVVPQSIVTSVKRPLLAVAAAAPTKSKLKLVDGLV